jgi:hypothetical protein
VIPRETKDWTFVLERPCPECGLDVRSIPPETVAVRLREVAAGWRGVLTGPGQLGIRPAPTVWAPVEYACHVRDVCRIFHSRLQLMLTEDDPLFPNWDQDQAAEDGRYLAQEPRQVASELGAAAEVLAAAFDQVAGAQWDRTGTRSDGAHFTVRSFARYLLHDVAHHLYDVTGPSTRR